MLPSSLKINKEKRNIWVQISWKAQSEILNNPDSSWTLSFFFERHVPSPSARPWERRAEEQGQPGRRPTRRRTAHGAAPKAPRPPDASSARQQSYTEGSWRDPPPFPTAAHHPGMWEQLLHLQDWLGRCFSAHLAVSKGFKIFDLRPFSKHFKLPNR